MTGLVKFALGLLLLLISFIVTPVTTTIILGLFLLWCLGWLIVFLIAFIPRSRAAWAQANAEIKSEDEEWDALLAKYRNAEFSGQLIAARNAGWSPKAAKITIQHDEDAQQAKNDAEIEMIKTHDAREDVIERDKKIAYWIARASKRKDKTKAV